MHSCVTNNLVSSAEPSLMYVDSIRLTHALPKDALILILQHKALSLGLCSAQFRTITKMAVHKFLFTFMNVKHLPCFFMKSSRKSSHTCRNASSKMTAFTAFETFAMLGRLYSQVPFQLAQPPLKS